MAWRTHGLFSSTQRTIHLESELLSLLLIPGATPKRASPTIGKSTCTGVLDTCSLEGSVGEGLLGASATTGFPQFLEARAFNGLHGACKSYTAWRRNAVLGHGTER